MVVVVVVVDWGRVRDDGHSGFNTFNEMQYNASLQD